METEKADNGVNAPPDNPTWTFRPAADVKRLLNREITRISGGKKFAQRGLRSRLLNDALRLAFAKNRKKRELNKA